MPARSGTGGRFPKFMPGPEQGKQSSIPAKGEVFRLDLISKKVAKNNFEIASGSHCK
jgi:hypothetical protein